MCAKKQVKMRWMLFFWLGLTGFILPAMACSTLEEPELYVPETPRQYTAQTTPVEAYVLIDEAGNVVDFDQPYAYGVTANMRYVLRFWDVGRLGAAGYEAATIHRAYTPLRITGINEEIAEGMTDEQKEEIYSRSVFPTTEVKWADLTFGGGPHGFFAGTNPETGEQIYGYMDWREDVWEMHVVFTRDIQQDYLVIDDEPFYNWP